MVSCSVAGRGHGSEDLEGQSPSVPGASSLTSHLLHRSMFSVCPSQYHTRVSSLTRDHQAVLFPAARDTLQDGASHGRGPRERLLPAASSVRLLGKEGRLRGCGGGQRFQRGKGKSPK